MSLESKVIWSEGMFINPQHFQQQDRYFESLIQRKYRPYGDLSWGLQALELDQHLLRLGKIGLQKAVGVFPDGTPFSFPDIDEAPSVIDIPAGLHNTYVYLALPVRRHGAIDVQKRDNAQALARYFSAELPVRDNSRDGGEDYAVEVGKLRLRLLLETDDLSGYVCIGVAKIVESRDDKNILLDEHYLPTSIELQGSHRLSGFISELVGLLHHRAEAIAGRLADTRRGGTAEIADYMLLQLINRAEPHLTHLSQVRTLHPEPLYGELVKLAGELATFVTKGKRPPTFGAYQHDNLQQTFTPVISTLREYLTQVYEQTAIALALIEKKYGIRVSEINDRSLIGSASFILAVRADVPDELVRNRLPAQMKIGPVERIRELVNAALPGITLRALPVAPRQIPFRSNTTYFELDRHSEFWKELKVSGGFAMHLGGDFPGIEMEFWAIRQ